MQTNETEFFEYRPGTTARPYGQYMLDAGFTPLALEDRVDEARRFHAQFLGAAECGAAGLRIARLPEWGEKLIRRSGGVPQAVIAKLGSNLFSKRRPQDTSSFLSYIEKRYGEGTPLELRIVVGPVKNVRRCGAEQDPDLAEYLMFVQLSRLMEALVSLYPHGIRVRMIPDDLRGKIANGWPGAYSVRYISGLRRMVRELRFEGWLEVEEGQARLYDQYNVQKYFEVANESVLKAADYRLKLAQACHNARENFVAFGEMEIPDAVLHNSAMRYLVSYEAETLSGMWSAEDALPLIYASHPGQYQLYTMGQGITKLPWQIRLPLESIALPLYGKTD
jgi:hypothetical protein